MYYVKFNVAQVSMHFKAGSLLFFIYIVNCYRCKVCCCIYCHIATLDSKAVIVFTLSYSYIGSRVCDCTHWHIVTLDSKVVTVFTSSHTYSKVLTALSLLHRM